MASGRTPEVAARNADIKANAHVISPARHARFHGMALRTLYAVLSDPNSHVPTSTPARTLVRPLEGLQDGLSHGSESGYRRCRVRYGTACDDCQTAHALRNARQAARRRGA